MRLAPASKRQDMRGGTHLFRCDVVSILFVRNLAINRNASDALTQKVCGECAFAFGLHLPLHTPVVFAQHRIRLRREVDAAGFTGRLDARTGVHCVSKQRELGPFEPDHSTQHFTGVYAHPHLQRSAGRVHTALAKR